MSQIRETIEMQKCEGQQVLQQVQQFVHLLQK